MGALMPSTFASPVAGPRGLATSFRTFSYPAARLNRMSLIPQLAAFQVSRCDHISLSGSLYFGLCNQYYLVPLLASHSRCISLKSVSSQAVLCQQINLSDTHLLSPLT